jgi:DNA segregation ATPase FtsK/SpoIIIE, S-DNA-T family
MDQVKTFNAILANLGIKASCVDFKRTENYSYYDITLGSKSKVKDLKKWSEEISLALKERTIPNIKIMHDLGLVRFEFISNRDKSLNLFDINKNSILPSGDLMCLLGKSHDGQDLWMDVADNPHMIIAGTTGSGKSTLLHNIIANLLINTKSNIFLVDPKNIEFIEYDKRIRDRINVSYSYDESSLVLRNTIATMESRYDLMKSGVPARIFPSIVLIIDEFADLIMQDKDKSYYTNLCKLAQKSRAAKIHMILSTQRPSVNVIDGTIKANFPARISCKVASSIDSRIVIDSNGAENLLGKGDALIKSNKYNLDRFQVAYTSAQEVCANYRTSW